MLSQLITVTASSGILVLGLVNSAFAAPQDFVSNWVNTNPNTKKITRLAISLTKPNSLSIDVFEAANCTLSFDCSLGTTQLINYNIQGSKHQFARAEYGKGFSRTVLILKLSGVGKKNLSRRILLQRFTPDKSNRQKINFSQEFFMPTAQIWPLPSPCFFQDPRRCLKNPPWVPRPRR